MGAKTLGYLASAGLLTAVLCYAEDPMRTEVQVIAIEYPPFTTVERPDRGLGFALLNARLGASPFQISAEFLPPARAQRHMLHGHWCASFYPPAPSDTDALELRLDAEPVRLGLYRLRQSAPFRWSGLEELKGRRVAMLRANTRTAGPGAQMLEAGLILVDVETPGQGLQLLLRGRVDYSFGDSFSGRELMQALALDPARVQFSDSDFGTVPIGLWLNRLCPEAWALKAYLDRH